MVIRNVGKRAANGVRVSHFILPPDFSVYPAVPWTIEVLPGGGRDLVFPLMVPGQQVEINYLYPPPIMFGQVTIGVRSVEGFAKVVNVLPTPQPPRWQVIILGGFTTVGALVIAYLATSALIAGLRRVFLSP